MLVIAPAAPAWTRMNAEALAPAAKVGRRQVRLFPISAVVPDEIEDETKETPTGSVSAIRTLLASAGPAFATVTT